MLIPYYVTFTLTLTLTLTLSFTLKDSELLISYLTVPYLRIPLVLSLFATEDRLHSLRSPELQALLDSVLFEPGR